MALDGASNHLYKSRKVNAEVVFDDGLSILLEFQVLLYVSKHVWVEAQLLRGDQHPLVKEGAERVGEVVLTKQGWSGVSDGVDDDIKVVDNAQVCSTIREVIAVDEDGV